MAPLSGLAPERQMNSCFRTGSSREDKNTGIETIITALGRDHQFAWAMTTFRNARITLGLLAGVIGGIGLPPAAGAADTTPAAQLQRFETAAGTPGNVPKGQAFFNARHGGEWSCSSCHGAQPGQEGKHASTGKKIAPLAPGFNPRAFTDSAKVDKWFRRNCKDVLSRECSATEKADVLAYLISIGA